jgi:glutamyl-tRNA synthetase
MNLLKFLRKISGKKAPVVTRFAPSPTGFLHSGNYRTAVFSYLFSKKNDGKFVLRIEDTDRIRSKKEFENNILESLKWLGLGHDEMFRQSERTDIYKKYLEKLIAEDKAYLSKETREIDGKEIKNEVIRFRNPKKKVKFNDLIRGDIEFDTTELGDFIIAKSITEPIFHFAVVLDDYLMGITHIIRGEDHISNTPRQILIQEALGAPRPVYSHLPLVLATDRSKLSKRKGAQSMTYYKDAGYLPSALLNYMALLGWNPGTEEEILGLKSLVSKFNLADVQRGGAIFDEKKLLWINKEHLKLLPRETLEADIKARIESNERARDLGWKLTPEIIRTIAPVILDRIEVYSDIDTMVLERDLDYYFTEPEYDALSLRWKDETDLDNTVRHLNKVRSIMETVGEAQWNETDIKAVIWPYADENGRGAVLWPVRFALSGKDKSPNPFTLAGILGKETTLRRIDAALKKCADHAQLS